MKIYVVFLNDKPYKNTNGKTFFTDYQKAKNYRNNAIRNVARLICEEEDWYDMGEEKKQKWFDKADKLLSIKTFIEDEYSNVYDEDECYNCFNYNIGDGIDDIEKCYQCKNFKVCK